MCGPVGSACAPFSLARVKSMSEMSPAKLRGGFYSPDELVALCLDRVAELMPHGLLDAVEPSIGDGAFLRGLSHSALGARVSRVDGIEVNELEAEKSRRAMRTHGIGGRIELGSAVSWAARSNATYDVAIGNPPFLRYQFIGADDRDAIRSLGERLGLQFAGVGNLWIPVLLGCLARLRAGGAFAFVVPSECFTGVSAAVARSWLARNCASLRFDVFPPGSFPGVLQEVFVLSGTIATSGSDRRHVRVVERRADGTTHDWRHALDLAGPWTKYLLAPAQVEALETVMRASQVTPVGELAAFEVSIVTGANAFFTLTSEELARHDLEPWGRPLLPKIRHAPGLRYTDADHAQADAEGAASWILDFSETSASPLSGSGPAAYLAGGEVAKLNERYKCRIREPWYRVPGFRTGDLLLSKRSHHFPRVVVNEAGVYTTDTIYRGRLLQSSVSARTIAANFHNSLTLLTAELEGRSFGGGVLELVPSETARLLLPTTVATPRLLQQLDGAARGGDPSRLVRESDASLVQRGVVDQEVMAELATARASLAQRRFERNRPPGAGTESTEPRFAAPAA